MPKSRARTFASLLRWLGPWTGDAVVPDGMTCEPWVIREGELHGHRAHVLGLVPDEARVAKLEAFVYTPRDPVAMYVLAPGLHFAGPDDPRLDRFCRVLARAGFVVVAPFLPTFVDLRVAKSAADDFEVVARAACARFPELGPPAIFSISFGSWPALETAARMGDAIDGVITFGGYADFFSVVRFCTDGLVHTDGGAVRMPFDPLNLSAVFVNVVRYVDVDADKVLLERAFREMCYRTWGKMELKEPGRLTPFITAIASELPERERAFFLEAANGGAPSRQLIERGLLSGEGELSVLNAGHVIERLTCPVVVCHGRDDDVIPWFEAAKLSRALTRRVPTRLNITGLYAHTGAGRPKVLEVANEAKTLLALAHAISNGGRLREVIT